MYLTVPDIPAIRTSFSIKPSAYTVSAMPTSEEVTALRKAITWRWQWCCKSRCQSCFDAAVDDAGGTAGDVIGYCR